MEATLILITFNWHKDEYSPLIELTSWEISASGDVHSFSKFLPKNLSTFPSDLDSILSDPCRWVTVFTKCPAADLLFF